MDGQRMTPAERQLLAAFFSKALAIRAFGPGIKSAYGFASAKGVPRPHVTALKEGRATDYGLGLVERQTGWKLGVFDDVVDGRLEAVAAAGVPEDLVDWLRRRQERSA